MRPLARPLALIVLLINPVHAQDDVMPANAVEVAIEEEPLAEHEQGTPHYPAAIQRMIDEHDAKVLGRGTIGDLAFFLVHAGDQRRTFLTSPDGFLITGKVYRPDGSLLFDTEARPPIETATLTDTDTRPEATANDDRALIQQALSDARGGHGATAVWPDLGVATVIEEGAADAPLIYAFFDLYCPYCHQQWQQLRAAVQEGRYRIRWVPVAVLEPSKQDIGAVLGLLSQPTAPALADWMAQRTVSRQDRRAAKIALIRNNTLFKRLQSNRVPTLLYQQAEGTSTMHEGLLSL